MQLTFILQTNEIHLEMATAKIPENVQESDFDWLQLRKDINSASLQESSRDKLIRKVKENPFVPVGKQSDCVIRVVHNIIV